MKKEVTLIYYKAVTPGRFTLDLPETEWKEVEQLRDYQQIVYVLKKLDKMHLDCKVRKMIIE